jgi:hypothetical protein
LHFWEETTHYELGWQTRDRCKVLLLMKFIGGHSRKSNKSTMLARFICFPHGFELWEANIHDHDDPLSGGLTMFVVSGILVV